MARSKSGGTRSYIRGKIGADVYCVGKDGKGSRQQVVRSLAEQVANPQTSPQMVQRMLMSCVAQLTRGLKPIIDHSFAGIPAGQPSISHFRSLALDAYKEDSVKAEPLFGYVGWKEKMFPNALVQISSGKVRRKYDIAVAGKSRYTETYNCGGFVAAIANGAGEGAQSTQGGHMTYQEIALQLFDGDLKGTITYVALLQPKANVAASPFVAIMRLMTNDNIYQDIDAWNEDNWTEAQGLTIDCNCKCSVNVVTGKYSNANGGVCIFCLSKDPQGRFISDTYDIVTEGVITAKHNGKGGWDYTESYLEEYSLDQSEASYGHFVYAPDASYGIHPHTLSVALATYPLGEARFLNGGDI